MGYRKVYRTVDEQTTKKMVKMLQRHGIMAYGKSEGAGEILQITTGIPYQGRVVYVKEEQAEEAKKRIADWEKKGEFPEPLRTQSHTTKARIAALIWVIIIVMGILFIITGLLIVGIGYQVGKIYRKYCWDIISIVEVITSTAIAIYFGDWIKSVISINLITLLLLVHVVYIGIRCYVKDWMEERGYC